MLLVWLFGVVAGVANACVLGSAPEHAPGAAAAQVEHSLSLSQHGGQDQGGEANCQEFCDLASTALPSQPAQLDQVAAAAISLGFTAVALPLAPPLRLQPVRPPPRNDAPPIPIAFLRLTL